jgi:hypothetical protein
MKFFKPTESFYGYTNNTTYFLSYCWDIHSTHIGTIRHKCGKIKKY